MTSDPAPSAAAANPPQQPVHIAFHPDLTLRRMKSNVNGLLWGISRTGARSEVRGHQDSNSAMLNVGGRLLNIITDQCTAEYGNN